jgi:hypothetical protein
MVAAKYSADSRLVLTEAETDILDNLVSSTDFPITDPYLGPASEANSFFAQSYTLNGKTINVAVPCLSS